MTLVAVTAPGSLSSADRTPNNALMNRLMVYGIGSRHSMPFGGAAKGIGFPMTAPAVNGRSVDSNHSHGRSLPSAMSRSMKPNARGLRSMGSSSVPDSSSSSSKIPQETNLSTVSSPRDRMRASAALTWEVLIPVSGGHCRRLHDRDAAMMPPCG